MDSNFHTVHPGQPYTTSLLVEPLYAKVVHFCSFVTKSNESQVNLHDTTMSSNPSFSAPCPSNSHPIHRPSCYRLTIIQSSMSPTNFNTNTILIHHPAATTHQQPCNTVTCKSATLPPHLCHPPFPPYHPTSLPHLSHLATSPLSSTPFLPCYLTSLPHLSHLTTSPLSPTCPTLPPHPSLPYLSHLASPPYLSHLATSPLSPPFPPCHPSTFPNLPPHHTPTFPTLSPHCPCHLTALLPSSPEIGSLTI